jgi:PKD repeat protein
MGKSKRTGRFHRRSILWTATTLWLCLVIAGFGAGAPGQAFSSPAAAVAAGDGDPGGHAIAAHPPPAVARPNASLPGSTPLTTFDPITHTLLPGGTYTFDAVHIRAGVIVTITGDVAISVTGTVDIAGALVGDCFGLDLRALGNITITGKLDNRCSDPAAEPGDLLIYTYGGDMIIGTVDTPAELYSSGNTYLSNDPTIPEWEFDVLPYQRSGTPLPPVCSATADTLLGTAYVSPTAGAEVGFFGEGADPDGGPVTYQWDLGDTSSSTETNPVHTYDAWGAYDVVLTVTDDEGQSCQASLRLLVEDDEANLPAEPAVQAEPAELVVPAHQEAYFYAAALDPQWDELSYRWDLGDASTSTETNPIHSYADPGRYEVTLVVTDTEGYTSTARAAVYVYPSFATFLPVVSKAAAGSLLVAAARDQVVDCLTPGPGFYNTVDVKPQAAAGKNGADIRYTGRGNIVLGGGTNMRAGKGGDGVDRNGIGTIKGGHGGQGGSLQVLVTGRLTICAGAYLASGDGGRGGNATSNTPAPGEAKAQGGKGGQAGASLTIRASQGVTFDSPLGIGVVVVNPGSGGAGGAAIAVGGAGAAGGAQGQPGAAALAIGGDGGAASKMGRGGAAGLGNLVVDGGQGGKGGDANATGGKGGNANAAGNANGGNGGPATARGGKGGKASYSGAFRGSLSATAFTAGAAGAANAQGGGLVTGLPQGGGGGNATATAPAPCGDATATGGNGARARARGGQGGAGRFNGNGGNATATAGAGGQATATGGNCLPCLAGGTGTATGGTGGDAEARFGLRGGRGAANGVATATGGTGGAASATGGDGGDCNVCPGGAGGAGGAALATGGNGGNATGNGARAGGNGGKADALGGLGGKGATCCTPPQAGGNGGTGGSATSTAGNPGAPGGAFGANGIQGGDGGNGGDGEPSGAGGPGGLGTGTPADIPDGDPGQPGGPCPCQPPADSGFGWAPPNPISGQVITFTGSASGTMPMTFTWGFGDYTFGQGNPITKIYEMAGDYLVTMTATNACGYETVTHVVTVEPSSCVPPHDASFTWFPAEPFAGYPITFTGEASGTPPIVFTWDFGDGVTATGRTVMHIFEMPGDYNVAMTAVNVCGSQMVLYPVHVSGAAAVGPARTGILIAVQAAGRPTGYRPGPAGPFYLPVVLRR